MANQTQSGSTLRCCGSPCRCAVILSHAGFGQPLQLLASVEKLPTIFKFPNLCESHLILSLPHAASVTLLGGSCVVCGHSNHIAYDASQHKTQEDKHSVSKRWATYIYTQVFLFVHHTMYVQRRVTNRR